MCDYLQSPPPWSGIVNSDLMHLALIVDHSFFLSWYAIVDKFLKEPYIICPPESGGKFRLQLLVVKRSVAHVDTEHEEEACLAVQKEAFLAWLHSRARQPVVQAGP